MDVHKERSLDSREHCGQCSSRAQWAGSWGVGEMPLKQEGALLTQSSAESYWHNNSWGPGSNPHGRCPMCI
jgi:hypothetical protein